MKHGPISGARQEVTDLRRQTVRGGYVTIAAVIVRNVISIAGTMILARILAPADFGLIAMVMSILGVAMIVRDAGLMLATVQRREIEQREVGTLFWINAGIGFAAAVLAAACAPLVARFFGDPRLTLIGVIVSGTILIDALSVQHQALLRRRMRFGSIAIAEIGAQIPATIVAVMVARSGGSYWALVWLKVVEAIIRMIAFWSFSGWWPGFVFAWARVKPFLRFGGALTLTRLLVYLVRTLDRVLIGRFLDAASLGIYAKAGNWLLTPLQTLTFPLSRVAIGTLSRLQDDAARYRAYFRTAADGIAFLLFPGIAFAMLEADTIVRVFLGEKWLAGVPIFRILLPVAVTTIFRMFTRWVFVSKGHVGRQLRWEVLVLVMTVAGFAYGIRWGVEGIAAASAVVSVILLVPSVTYCVRNTPLRAWDILRTPFWPGGAGLAAAGATAVVFRALGEPGLVARLFLSLGVFSGIYLAILLAFPAPRARIRELRGFARLGR